MQQEVIIVGGGMVGLSLALMLATANIAVKLLEAVKYPNYDDNNAVAVSYTHLDAYKRQDHQYVDNPWVKPTERKTQASSVYTEFSIPLLSSDHHYRFAKSLEMQIAARYEDFKVSAKVPQYDPKADPTTGYKSNFLGYSDSGTAKFDAISPTIGFKFEPNDQMMFRASYSEGFVTPTVGQLALETVLSLIHI